MSAQGGAGGAAARTGSIGSVEAADLDRATVDGLLATTRAVRRRLDPERPVPPALVEECLGLALQAPSERNRQRWRWLVVTDAGKRRALAELCERAGRAAVDAARTEARARGDADAERLYAGVDHLLGVLARVPVHVVPCLEGRPPPGAPPIVLSSFYGSIYPAVWSFQLALRSRGLGSVLTTLHLGFEAEAAALLGVPDDAAQIALLPVAWTRGTAFRPAARQPVQAVTGWNGWGRARRSDADAGP